MTKQTAKFLGLLAAFVPLCVSVVELYNDRATAETRSVEMEDEIVKVVEGLNLEIDELNKRIGQLETIHLLKLEKPNKPRRKDRSYNRQWSQQNEK